MGCNQQREELEQASMARYAKLSPQQTLWLYDGGMNWDRVRGKLKLLWRLLLWALAPPLLKPRIPDDDYGAKDLDDGGIQTLFGSKDDSAR